MLKIIAQIGFLPNLDSCIVCGMPQIVKSGNLPVGIASHQIGFSYAQGGIICNACMGLSTDENRSGADTSPVAMLNADLLDWVVILIRGRFVELMAYADTSHQVIGRLLLAFARDWMRAQVAPRNRSLDFYMELR
ncbi:MAG: hypothetical protein LBU61_01535, partial [Coriobacteriales bacterium]|jgi:recombinational DNA repair protein (RecF pathway)|nr:hypothetical protein [Coriobacteriales bacterium]